MGGGGGLWGGFAGGRVGLAGGGSVVGKGGGCWLGWGPRGSVPGIRKRSENDPKTILENDHVPGIRKRSENDPKDFRSFLDPPNPPGPSSGCRRVLEQVREGGIRASLRGERGKGVR